MGDGQNDRGRQNELAVHTISTVDSAVVETRLLVIYGLDEGKMWPDGGSGK